MRKLLISLIAAVLLIIGCAQPAIATGGVLPVPGPVIRSFDPPDVPWGSGHRGVDIEAAPGTVVIAPAPGVVSFAGMVAGRPVLVINHGDTRSTLEPVVATVAVGRRVAMGEAVGNLVAGHTCASASCLHWGLLRGEQYLDPLSLLSVREPRLLPDDEVASIRERAERREASASEPTPPAPGSNPNRLARPVPGGIGSPFGMRFHPIFHVWRLHAGIDLHASCGTPIRAASDGTVSRVGFDSSGGWRLTIEHGPVGGVALSTSYLHAQGYGVREGEHVSRGQVVGWVGSTGWSTGCHLHFGVRADGRVVDPQPWIS